MPRVETLWGAWKKQPLALDFPPDWQITEYRLAAHEPVSEAHIEAAVGRALDGAGVENGSGSVSIAVDDITRPCAWSGVLEVLLARLNARGWPDGAIHILISLAGHAPMDPEEIERKLGSQIPRRIAVHQHSLEADFEWFEHRKARAGINARYAAAALRIIIGSVIPHPFAGFSGGAKAIMPGLADHETIRRNHLQVAFGKGRVADVNNAIRREMEEIAAYAAPHAAIQAVCDGELRTVSLHAGPLAETYAAAAGFARAYCAAPVRNGHTVLVLNGFPKDDELLQVTNAFNVLRTLPPAALESCKAVVMLGAAGKGLGFHALFGPGGSLFRAPKPAAFLRGAKLIGFFPGAAAADFYQVFSGDAVFAASWPEVVDCIGALDGGAQDAAFFHQASLQIAGAAAG